jgi:hypothetical protein
MLADMEVLGREGIRGRGVPKEKPATTIPSLSPPPIEVCSESMVGVGICGEKGRSEAISMRGGREMQTTGVLIGSARWLKRHRSRTGRWRQRRQRKVSERKCTFDLRCICSLYLENVF